MLRSIPFHNLRRYLSTAVTATQSPNSLFPKAIPSKFSHVPQGPEDPILGVTVAYNSDPSPQKINLGVGAYRDDTGQPFVLKSVREAECRLLDKNMDMEYLPVCGHRSFIEKVIKLAYGDENEYVKHNCYAAVQALGGTGACRIGAEFLKKFYNMNKNDYHHDEHVKILLPSPTWSNHPKIFKHAGCQINEYKYYDDQTRGLNFSGLIDSLKNAQQGSIVLLHACAHNPTGVDPNIEQWKEISMLMKEKNLLPFFDMAYQGFTSGNLDQDAQALRLFVKDGHKILLAQSFAKNFGLYGHRVACFSILTDSIKEAQALESQLKILIRPMYSNPPIHGVRIVNEILSDHDLDLLWRKEMKNMAQRIIQIRSNLKEDLIKVGSILNWDHIVNQHGMFCYSGLTKEQVETLKKEHSVYLTANGRISMAGVTSKNVYYLANAIHEVTK